MYPHKFYQLPSQKRRVKGDYHDMNRMCLRKISLISMEEAKEFAKSANDDPTNEQRFIKRMDAYKCPYCEFYHIGRKKPPNRYEEDREYERLLQLGFNDREARASLIENTQQNYRKHGWAIKKVRRRYITGIIRKAMRGGKKKEFKNPNARENFRKYIRECDEISQI